MKLLKYLKLNFRPYRCECRLYTCSDYVYLEFNQLIVEDTSLSNLETLIIGGKLFLLQYICFVYFIMYVLR
jgi:hypothetical protein